MCVANSGWLVADANNVPTFKVKPSVSRCHLDPKQYVKELLEISRVNSKHLKVGIWI